MCMSLTLEFNVVLTIDMEGPQGDLVIVCVSHDESVNDGQEVFHILSASVKRLVFGTI